MKRVYVAANDIEANALKAALDDCGIPATVQGERLGPLAGRGSANAFPEIWVRDDADSTKVAAILAEYEQKLKAPSIQAETLPHDDASDSREDERPSELALGKPSSLSAAGRRKAVWVAVCIVLGIFAFALLVTPRVRFKKLYDAVRLRDAEQVRGYLDAGADPNLRDQAGWTLLNHAVTNDALAVVRELLNHGADVNAKGKDGVTPLHSAAWRGYTSIAELLLANGAHANAVDDQGFTPLHFAAEKGHVAVAALLLQQGARIDARTPREGTALLIAAYYGHEEMVDYLIAHKADVNASGDRHWTALHYAADRGYLPVVDLLIKKGANVDARGENGCTPLHVAANVGNAAIVALLIANNADVNALGADITAKEPDGKTPLDIALSKNYTDIANLLRESGGKSGDQSR